jgi:hypothetical protein
VAILRAARGDIGLRARRYYGSFVSFDGRGEMIPNEQPFCDIDPTVKDKWGIPGMARS